MLGLAESVKHTRVYQEGREEGLLEGWQREQKLIIRLLNRRFGAMAPALQSQIKTLPLEQLEALGEALLDFSQVTDLIQWLETNT